MASKIAVVPPLPSALARLTGSAGAVEASATVRLANTSAAERSGQPVTASAQAASDGAFTVSVPAQLGDQLEVTAVDAAGNVSGVLLLQAGPTPTTLSVVDPGDDHLLTLTSGQGAFNLPFTGGNERYTLVVQSVNPVGASFPLTVSGSEEVEIRTLNTSAQAETSTGLEKRIRELERRLKPTMIPGFRGRGLEPADDPALGSTRTFFVINEFETPVLTNPNHFDEVTARLRYKGDHTLIYVDTRAEGPNVPNHLIDDVGDRFDDQTYDVDRNAFGEETDIDGNGRVIILMTPGVNASTPKEIADQGSFRSGFFFAIDLFDDPFVPFGNDGEVFYTLVPDPTKQFGHVDLTVDEVAGLLDGVLAHEFEHMINAGHRRAPGVSFETLWFDEGLAHYAETLNAVESNGQVDLQNSLRAALWLQKPYAFSFLTGDLLEQRGAQWLLVAYLVGQYGEGILHDLAAGPLVGIPNVENAADTSFQFLFYRFTAALLLDGQGISTDPFFDFPGLDLRQRFQTAKQAFASDPLRLPGSFLGIQSSTVPGALSATGISILGGTPAYFEVRGQTSGDIPVIVSADRQSNLQVTIIRTQ